ncbi:MAG: J domain-containing protein [Acidobacteria bacterium]|nr:J domain-containing protein [Acidobacteriota bacterium]
MNDARAILGVGPQAGDAEIRAAYLKKVKEHPPDHSPAEFEKIRDAYEILRDPRRRARQLMEASNCPLSHLLSDTPAQPRHVPIELWLEVLKGK